MTLPIFEIAEIAVLRNLPNKSLSLQIFFLAQSTSYYYYYYFSKWNKDHLLTRTVEFKLDYILDFVFFFENSCSEVLIHERLFSWPLLLTWNINNFYSPPFSVSCSLPNPNPPSTNHNSLNSLDLSGTSSEEGKWSCSECTFSNHPSLDTCEICEMPRITIG